MSVFPNWAGRDEERFFEFRADGTLTLSAPPALRAGKMRSVRVT